MVKVLIIDDGTPDRASKTMIYGLFAQRNGADLTKENLKNLTNPSQLQGYDLIFTDLDALSVEDNKKFLDLLAAASASSPPPTPPTVKMFSGAFRGVEGDLPIVIPASLAGAVTTHNSTSATQEITSSVKAVAATKPPSPGAQQSPG